MHKETYNGYLKIVCFLLYSNMLVWFLVSFYNIPFYAGSFFSFVAHDSFSRPAVYLANQIFLRMVVLLRLSERVLKKRDRWKETELNHWYICDNDVQHDAMNQSVRSDEPIKWQDQFQGQFVSPGAPMEGASSNQDRQDEREESLFSFRWYLSTSPSAWGW